MEEVDRSKLRVLVVNTSWPSKEHPYLVYLFPSIKAHFKRLQFFLFRKESDVLFANNLIGELSVRELLKDALYRFSLTTNPLSYLPALFRFLRHPLLTLTIFNRCRGDGYNVYQALGQLLYNYQLVGRQYDLVYINALQTARHFSIRSFFPDCKVLVSSRGQDFDWNPTGYDSVLRNIDHLHVLGSYLREKAVGRGFFLSRISVIPPATLPRKAVEIVSLHGESDAMYVVSSSRLIWTKGYTYALRAFALLLKMLAGGQKCYYIILGDGPDKDYLRAEISRLKIDDYVLLKGWVGQPTVNEWLSRADIYMLLSIEEGFNNSVMQAQSFGVPCVVSDAGGLPENVVHGRTGIVVPRYSVTDAANALHHLIRDSALRKQLGTEARLRMDSDFGLQVQVSKYIGMFDELLKDNE